MGVANGNGGNIVQLISAGKIRCYITGQLRSDKPEENIRQRWARSLVEEYRYKEDIALEFPIKMGTAKLCVMQQNANSAPKTT
jgi:hypothetical protein